MLLINRPVEVVVKVKSSLLRYHAQWSVGVQPGRLQVLQEILEPLYQIIK
jgi:hypothetical protein